MLNIIVNRGLEVIKVMNETAVANSDEMDKAFEQYLNKVTQEAIKEQQ
jgi:hypothetical protein